MSRPEVWMHLRASIRTAPHRQPIHAIAAFGTRLIWTKLSDPFDDLNSHALLALASEKARTVCGCQAMATAIRATVAPSRRCSIVRTRACLSAFPRLTNRAGCRDRPQGDA